MYGLATMMLAADGHASYATSNTDYTSQENWFPEYDTAQQLGAPAGPYTVLANGVYERAFAHGIVLVNPTAELGGVVLARWRDLQRERADQRVVGGDGRRPAG